MISNQMADLVFDSATQSGLTLGGDRPCVFDCVALMISNRSLNSLKKNELRQSSLQKSMKKLCRDRWMATSGVCWRTLSNMRKEDREPQEKSLLMNAKQQS